MTYFCGQERCQLDANGRVKLPPRFVSAFQDSETESVVLHALPEGALGVYPEKTWQQMRRSEARPEEKVGSSIAYRRQARRFGAMTEVQKLSKQGRLTIPTLLRDVLELGPGVSAVLVGSEIGLEIWNEQRWQNELKAIMEHEQRKAALEMEADLNET